MNFASLFASNRFQEIITYFESKTDFVIDDNPSESHILAAAYFKSGEFDKAFKILQSLESVHYTNPEYLSLFGATCRRLMLHDKAKEYFLRAIDLQPESIELKNNYSNLLIDCGDPQAAINILQPIVDSSPDYTDAVQNLDRAQSLLNSQPGSFLEPNSSDLWDPMAIAFAVDEVEEFGRVKKKVELAITTSTESLPLPEVPTDALSSEYLTLAKHAISEKNYILALEYCTKVHGLASPISSTYSTCFDAYVALKRFHLAEICLLTSIVLSDASCSQYLNLASLASIRKDFKLAYLYLDKAASLDPSDPMLSKVRSNLDKLNSPKSTFVFSDNWSTAVK